MTTQKSNSQSISRNSSRFSGKWAPWLAASPLVIGIGIFALYPFIYLLILAFTESSLARLFQGWSGFDNFEDALDDSIFTGSVITSLLLAFMSTALAMIVGVAVALLLDQAVRARDFLRTLVLLPLLTPPVTAAIMWQLILMPKGGFINSVLDDLSLISQPVSFLGTSETALFFVAIVDVWQWAPFVALMSFAALQTLPSEVYEATKLEVRSKWRIFRSITLPMLMPALIGIAVLKLVIAFKVFDIIFILTSGGPGQATTVSSFHIYRVAIQQFDVGLAAAMTLLFIIVVSIATVPFTFAQGKAEEKWS